MATLWWMGYQKQKRGWLRVYENTTAIVAVGKGALEEFEVKIGLRKGSMLRPLLSMAILDLTSRKTTMKYAMNKLPFADNLYPVSNGKQELQATL